MQNLDSIILFPVDRLLKTELRGSKGDLKRPFDRAWKEYHDKISELERQKKKAAKEAGKVKVVAIKKLLKRKCLRTLKCCCFIS
jgi:Arf-GAP/SH3 domain/ANK repeat/PH domain-containing protein